MLRPLLLFLCVSLQIALGYRTALFTHGSFQTFCTLYVFSLKMNLFYKIYLQAFNVVSNVLYHSGPTLGQVLYSCQDAFVVDASDYSAHLTRQLLNAFQAFATEWFLQFWEQVKICWAHVMTVRRVAIHTFPTFPILHLRHEAWGCALSCKIRTPAASMADLFGESLDAKHLAETFCSMPVTADPGGTLLPSLHSCHKPQSSWA